MKKKSGMMGMTKDLVGSGMMLGTGATVLGAMGQGSIVGSVITPAANMLGPVASAGYGMGILNTISETTSTKKSKKHTI